MPKKPKKSIPHTTPHSETHMDPFRTILVMVFTLVVVLAAVVMLFTKADVTP